MDAENIYSRIQELPKLLYKISKRPADTASVQFLSDIHQDIYGSPVCPTCKNDHIKAYHTITSLTLEKLKEMANQQFKLNEGILLYFNHQHYTPETLTDEVAVDVIKSNPENIELFSEYPKDDEGNVVLDLPSNEEPATLTDAEKASVFKKGNFFYFVNAEGKEVKTTKQFLIDNGVNTDELKAQ